MTEKKELEFISSEVFPEENKNVLVITRSDWGIMEGEYIDLDPEYFLGVIKWGRFKGGNGDSGTEITREKWAERVSRFAYV